MKNKFPERVNLLLKQRGITKYQMSKETGISKSSLSDYCVKNVQPIADVILKVSEYFGVTTDFLLGAEDESGRRTNNI